MLGTKRQATKVAPKVEDAKIIITLQGDEALIFANAKAKFEEELGMRLHNHQAMTRLLRSIEL